MRQTRASENIKRLQAGEAEGARYHTAGKTQEGMPVVQKDLRELECPPAALFTEVDPQAAAKDRPTAQPCWWRRDGKRGACPPGVPCVGTSTPCHPEKLAHEVSEGKTRGHDRHGDGGFRQEGSWHVEGTGNIIIIIDRVFDG